MSRSEETLIYLTLIAIFILFILWLLDWVRSQLILITANKIEKRVGSKLAHKAITTNNQSLTDLLCLRNYLLSPYLFPILDAPWSVLILISLFFLHPILGIVTLVGILIILSLAILNNYVDSNISDTTTDVGKYVRNKDSIHAMSMMNPLSDKWKQKQHGVLGKILTYYSKFNLLNSFSRFIRQLLQIVIFGIGTWLVINAEISAGALIASAILAARALSPIEQSVGSLKQAVLAFKAYKRINTNLNTIPKEKAILTEPVGNISVKNLSYFVPNRTEPILDNISFSLEPTDKLAIIGPSGSGKTTLAKLLIGAINPTYGVIKFDGLDITKWDADLRGKYFGFLPQSIELFEGTIEENISRFIPDNEKVIEAAKASYSHNLIQSLPYGYQTKLESLVLSGGQTQKISLARTLYDKPKLIVLDEPTTHLDQQNEIELVSTIKQLDSIVIFVTHKMNLLDLATKVLVLKEGKMIAFGPKTEILSQFKQ
jgi:PrtD family type I secretion system ABC transporter